MNLIRLMSDARFAEDGWGALIALQEGDDVVSYDYESFKFVDDAKDWLDEFKEVEHARRECVIEPADLEDKRLTLNAYLIDIRPNGNLNYSEYYTKKMEELEQ